MDGRAAFGERIDLEPVEILPEARGPNDRGHFFFCQIDAFQGIGQAVGIGEHLAGLWLFWQINPGADDIGVGQIQ